MTSPEKGGGPTWQVYVVGLWRWSAARPDRLDRLANPRRPPPIELPELVLSASSERSVLIQTNTFRGERACARPGSRFPARFMVMERPSRFEHTRFLGDKRTQLVYDLDQWTDAATIDEIIDAETGLCFGPDTLVEARNRGYTLASPGKHRRHRAPRA